MSVWLVLPSKRPAIEAKAVLSQWSAQGYKVLIQRDESEALAREPLLDAFVVHYRTYNGYAEAVNYLAATVLRFDRECDWVVTAGDDTQPDMNHTAQQIATQCSSHFVNASPTYKQYPTEGRPGFILLPGPTLGVMQPTGDRWGHDRNTHTPQLTKDGRCSQCGHPKDHYRHMMGAYIDRVAGSPWMGREFCLRANQGKGPLWPGYYHMGCDEELQAVATRLGVFWQRPDLIHLHQHWGRGVGDAMGLTANMPDFLKRANSREEWAKYKQLFLEREAAGFPGSKPL